MNLSITIALLSCLTACSPTSSGQIDHAARNIIIVFSPSLADRPNILATSTTWLMHEANWKIHAYDGGSGTEVTEFAVPQLKYFKPGVVADHIGAPLQKLILWRQETAGDANLIGTGALAIPEILERIAQSHPIPDRLILVGSPVYRSAKNREFDFAEPRFRSPTKECLTRPKSPFSAVGKEHSLAGARIYFLFPNEITTTWPIGYEENLRRFYSAFFASRGGMLMAFTPDLAAGLQVVNSEAAKALEGFDLAKDSATDLFDESGPPLPLPLPTPHIAAGTNWKETGVLVSNDNSINVKVPPKAIWSQSLLRVQIPPRPIL